MTRRLHLVAGALAVGAALASCAEQPRIESFSVSPNPIKRGESATLSWSVKGAFSISLVDGTGVKVVGADESAMSGSVTVSPRETTSYVLAATGDAGRDFAILQLGVNYTPPGEAPLLVALLPGTIRAGETTTLVWSAPDVVELSDDAGTTLPTGDARSGFLPLTPTRTTVYTARAASQEVTAKVTVLPAIARFAASPSGAASGETIALSWTTAGATEVVVSERGRGSLYTSPGSAEAAQGQVVDTIPDLPLGFVLSYTLTAKNPDGEAVSVLEVPVANAPVFEYFRGPTAISRGTSAKIRLEWSVSNADHLSLFAGDAGGGPLALIYRTTFGEDSIELAPPSQATVFELSAESAEGAEASARLTVAVVDAATIAAFAAAPAAVAAGGDASVLTWQASNANALLVSALGGGTVYFTRDAGVIAQGSATVHPGQTTEYELEVTNGAGDRATARTTITVTSPLGFTFAPTVAVPGQVVTLSWSFPTALEIAGVPLDAAAPGSATFIDISQSAGATELTELAGVASTALYDAVSQRLDFPDGFRFRLWGKPFSGAYVTSTGWVGFADGYQSAAAIEMGTFPGGGEPNAVLAPFSTGLKGGRAFWALTGEAPSRALVIQWDRWSDNTTASEYTFELVMGEDGHADFLYKTISGPAVPVVGAEDQDGADGFVSAAALGNGTHLSLFGTTLSTGSVEVHAVETATFELAVKLSSGTVPVRGTLPVLRPGDLEITEVMYKPVAGATGGQWFEITNTTSFAIPTEPIVLDIGAVQVSLGGSRTLAPGQSLVVGQSANPAENGDTPVDVVPTIAFTLATAGTITLSYGTLAGVAVFSWNDVAKPLDTGVSLGGGSSAYRTPTGRGTCPSTTSYGTAGSKGTPGSASAEVCGPFVITQVPARFIDVTASGTSVIASDYEVRLLLTFPTGFKFPFFGADRSEALVGNGYIALDTSAGEEGYLDEFSDNPATYPSNATIPGTVAPFWDDFLFSMGDNSCFAQVFDPDHNPSTPDGYLVVMWVNQNLAAWSADLETNLNFEALLYENGDIEFQYGTMTPGSEPLLARGASATVGVSNMANSEAMVYSHDEPKIQPHTGIKFVRQ